MLSSGPASLKAYLRDEWQRAAIGFSLGALVGELMISVKTNHFLLAHLPFDEIVTGGQPAQILYKPASWFMLGPTAFVLLLLSAGAVWRAARSWACGVASGSVFWPLIIAAVSFFSAGSQYSVERGTISLVTVCLTMLVGFALRFSADLRAGRPTFVGETTRSRIQKPPVIARNSASPIESFEEDRLGRSAFIEALARTTLVSKAPVIALRGNFGDGKTSALNMLRQEIGSRAIVVSFSTWLPDSQKALAADLLDDIAIEISKQFVVPGLRKRLSSFASLLGGNLPYLKALADVLPPYTQRQEITDLSTLLSRLPKRVVVLLDEIDRMQKEELLMLLKLIRGVASVPNLTFVCAFHQEQVEKTACGSYDAISHMFMEKFFPTATDLPKLGADVLGPELRYQLLKIFDDLDWFTTAPERDEFLRGLDQLYNSTLCQVCTNIRKIGLLANDVNIAAALTRKEVDALDLCALEALRRFYPRAYEVIWTSGSFFANSPDWWKSISYRPPEVAEFERRKVSAAIEKLSSESNDEGAIMGLITHMFPERAWEIRNDSVRKENRGASLKDAAKRHRIFHPDYFPIYFCRAVPDAIFSAFEMERLMGRLQGTSSPTERQVMFSQELEILKKNSFRRYDFLTKIVQKLADLPISLARSIALAITSNSDKLADEFVSEIKMALSAVVAVAQRLSGASSESSELNVFLAECIIVAKTDLFAEQVYTRVTSGRPEEDGAVSELASVDNLQLRSAFANRMNDRYGASANAIDFELAQGDIRALFTWAGIGQTERSAVTAFWKRYVGTSQGRLAEVYSLVAPIEELWTEETPKFINQIIPIAVLQQLYSQIDRDDQLEPGHKEALGRLKRFLNQTPMPQEVL